MFTINMNGASFEEIQMKMQMLQYQSLANQIIETYDFNDIKIGIRHAKDSIPRVEALNNQEKLMIIDSLFESLIGWLQKNGKKV